MSAFDPHAVANARASAGMSQRDLAQAVGVSRATIQNTESRASTPSADIVARMTVEDVAKREVDLIAIAEALDAAAATADRGAT